MLELLAIASEDGWAFVRTEGDIVLARPPYSASNSSSVSEASVEKAVVHHGFSASEREFPNWRELIEFLNQQVRETRDARGEEIQREGLGAQMMEFASRDILENFLSRVETELLPSASWEPAERLLIDMLQLPQIQQNKQLLSRATNLLKLTVKARRKSQTRREDLLKEENGILDRCPVLQGRYDLEELEDYNNRMAQRGHVLLIGE